MIDGVDAMNENRHSSDADETDIARLLARVGPRSEPPARAAAEVRAAVAAAWRQTVDTREQRRRYTGWAVAAGVAVAAVGAWLARPLYLPEPVTVATLARVVGEVQVESGRGQWMPLVAGSVIKSGAVVRTGAEGRAALELESGVSLRLDTATQLAFDDAQEAALSRGAVYVDSGAEAASAGGRFVVATPAGNVRHLGTQYEARLADNVLQVGVREGRIEVSGAHASVIGNAGEVLSIGAGGVTRSALPPNSPAWDWVADVTPPFSIEGRTVDEFLTWAGREMGRKVVYGSPEVERAAKSVTLSGTVEGLPPQQAVAAVLATASLTSTVADDSIEVGQAQH